MVYSPGSSSGLGRTLSCASQRRAVGRYLSCARLLRNSSCLSRRSAVLGGVWRGSQTCLRFWGKTQVTRDSKRCQVYYICKQRTAERREGLGFRVAYGLQVSFSKLSCSDLTVLQRLKEIDLAIKKIRRALGAVSAVAGRRVQAGTRKFIKLLESTEKMNLQKLSG